MALLAISVVSLRCDAFNSAGTNGCGGSVAAPTSSEYSALPLGLGRSDGPQGRRDAPAFAAVLTQGPFRGASYIQIGSEENREAYITIDRFYPDNLVVGGSTLVSVFDRGGGGTGYMRVSRLTATTIEGTFGACTRIEGTGGIQGPGTTVLGGFHVAR